MTKQGTSIKNSNQPDFHLNRIQCPMKFITLLNGVDIFIISLVIPLFISENVQCCLLNISPFFVTWNSEDSILFI